MNYLTNYYKNLCEQLQERLNILENKFDRKAEMAADRVWNNRKPLSQMTEEEAYQHGQDHALTPGVTPHPDMFKNPYFYAGFHDTLHPKMEE